MNLTNETAIELVKALNGFSDVMHEFNRVHSEGLTLEPETHDSIRALTNQLRDFKG